MSGRAFTPATLAEHWGCSAQHVRNLTNINGTSLANRHCADWLLCQSAWVLLGGRLLITVWLQVRVLPGPPSIPPFLRVATDCLRVY